MYVAATAWFTRGGGSSRRGLAGAAVVTLSHTTTTTARVIVVRRPSRRQQRPLCHYDSVSEAGVAFSAVRSPPATRLSHHLAARRFASLRGGQEEEDAEEQSTTTRTTTSPSLSSTRRETPRSISSDADPRDSGVSHRKSSYKRPSSIASSTGASVSEDASSSSSASSLSRRRRTFWETRLAAWRRTWRRRAGEVLAVGGFVASAAASLFLRGTRGDRRRRRLLFRWPIPTDALTTFLRESRLDEQLSPRSLLRSPRVVVNDLVVLGRVQKRLQEEGDDDAAQTAWARCDGHGKDDDDVDERPSGGSVVRIPTPEEALRYARFATAAYGDAMIRAARLDVTGEYHHDDAYSFSSSSSPDDDLTRTRVGEHVNVPVADVVVWDVDHHRTGDDDDDERLRHFVAVDHVHGEIVLSLRGTYSLAELVVSATGFATPFVGGQAHAAMAEQAEAVWKTAGPTIGEVWEDHPSYTLIITGHSLGAGTACLLHLYLHEAAPRLLADHRVRCMAFAAPPVYADADPSPAVRRAMTRCVNFIHGHDVVPFLSVDSVRQLLSALQWVDDKTRRMRFSDRLKLLWGYGEIDPSWAMELRQLPRLDPIPGAPVLTIPAAVNLWLTPWDGSQPKKSSDDGDVDDEYDPNVYYYQSHRCDSSKLATLPGGIPVDLRMLQDHFPARYEHALHHFHPDARL